MRQTLPFCWANTANGATSMATPGASNNSRRVVMRSSRFTRPPLDIPQLLHALEEGGRPTGVERTLARSGVEIADAPYLALLLGQCNKWRHQHGSARRKQQCPTRCHAIQPVYPASPGYRQAILMARQSIGVRGTTPRLCGIFTRNTWHGGEFGRT